MAPPPLDPDQNSTTIDVDEEPGLKNLIFQVGPIAERSKSSNRGQGDPGSDPGRSRIFFSTFFLDGELSGSHIVCFYT